MKRVLIIAIAAAVTAAAYGKLGDLVASFPNQPRTYTHYGLAADAGYLYSYYYTTGYHIYRMLRSNGSLVSSYPNPLGTTTPNSYCRGLSYGGGTYLYINNYYTRVVGRFYASTGSLVSTWTWPTSLSYRSGICCTHDGTNYGSYIYQNSNPDRNFLYSTAAGSLISSFHRYASYIHDLAWDYGNSMIWYGGSTTEHIYGITTTGSIVASWRVPEPVRAPCGVAYYGQRLYVSTIQGVPDEYIWVYDCPKEFAVAPASLGRVKALFR